MTGERDAGHLPGVQEDQVRHGHGDLDLLTPDDVCVLLKVKKSWLYDTVEDGALEPGSPREGWRL
jgi:hypothetical protein